MSQKALSVILRVICALCCIVLGFVIYCDIFLGGNLFFGEESRLYYFSETVVAVCAAAVIAAVIIAWRMFSDIGRNLSFTDKNAKRLSIISGLFLADTVIFVIFFGIAVFSGEELGLMSIVMMGIIFIGVSLSVICACLSHLIKKAAEIEKENELTV